MVSSLFILLQQSYIIFIFICYHPVVRKLKQSELWHLQRAVQVGGSSCTSSDPCKTSVLQPHVISSKRRQLVLVCRDTGHGHTRLRQASSHFPLGAVGMGEVLYSFCPSWPQSWCVRHGASVLLWSEEGFRPPNSQRKAGMVVAPPELHTDQANFSMGRTSSGSSLSTSSWLVSTRIWKAETMGSSFFEMPTNFPPQSSPMKIWKPITH